MKTLSNGRILFTRWLIALSGVVFLVFCAVFPAFSQNLQQIPENARTDGIYINGKRSGVAAGVSNYQKFDGTWHCANKNIYIDGETGEMYCKTVGMEALFPDTSTGWIESRIRNIEAGTYRSVRQRFTGAAYYERTTGRYTLLSPSPVSGTGITISGNTILYEDIYTGVDLKLAVYNDRLKQELSVSEQARSAMVSPYNPADTYVVLVTEIDTDGRESRSLSDGRELFTGESMHDSASIGIFEGNSVIFSLPFGYAFEESRRYDPARPQFAMIRKDTVINGRKFLLSGIPYPVIKNAETYPGTIVFDPSFQNGIGGYSGGEDAMLWGRPDRRDYNFGAYSVAYPGMNGDDSTAYYVKFDTTGMGIPENVRIDSVFLEFQPHGSGGNGSPSINFHLLRIACTEGTGNESPGVCNYDSASAGVAWEMSGGRGVNNDIYGTYYDTFSDTVQGTENYRVNVLSTASHLYGRDADVVNNGWMAIINNAESDEYYSWKTMDGGSVRLLLYWSEAGAFIEPGTFSADHKRITVPFDTSLFEVEPFDSFAILLADFSTRISPFTTSLNAVTYDTLSSLREYSFVIGGFNADTLRDYSITLTDTTDSLPHLESFTLDGIDYTSVRLSVVDTSGSRNLHALFYDQNGNTGTDTIWFDSDPPEVLADTLNFAGKYDSLVSLTVKLLDADNNEYPADTVFSFHIPAQKASALICTDTSETELTVIVPPDSNHPDIHYLIYDAAQNVFINSAGDTVADSAWAPKSVYDTLFISAGINTEHILKIYTRNSDSVITVPAEYDSLWSWAAVPSIDSVTAVDSVTIRLFLNPENNPPYTYFAVEDSLTGKFLDRQGLMLRSSGITADSTWAWGTWPEWGGLSGIEITVGRGQKLVLRAYSKDGNIR